ncbi:MATE family efflux transporter [Clostridioides mangenotii]|uniref:MATE family efflux transporter n=1 Tax=Metaclostridioides mangenotii TaxID=1540 RepID=UPI001C0F59CD|nr:MATE family efflux transporter [Clostridioides mangenotii]MBU5307229.1 MATE family efflux transporter [Clostridioides mangenotii]MCR1955331.1 MATE family efflux transporter [Clostridioides mangenotii]
MNSKGSNLGEEKISRLLFKLATPAIIAQLVNVLYNIVDRIFIGRMENGGIAMAGVGVSFPIILIISAFSALVGMGGGPLAAIKMGEKDNDGAEKIISNSFSILIIVSVILMLVFQINKENLLWLFGASESTIAYASDYLGIYLWGTLFVLVSMGMNPFINTQGFATTGMITVVIGAIINIILDPIFIFGLGMGVKGAALATIIAQGVSALWVLLFLFGKKSIIKIRTKYLRPNKTVVIGVLALGVSPFIMQATESLVLVSLNSRLQLYGGDLAVGAMTIMSSIMQIVMLPIVGLMQGAQPIMSYNYGAKNFDRVKSTFKLSILLCFSFAFIMWLTLMLFPEVYVSIFNNDKELLSMTSWSMRIYFAGIMTIGVQISCQQTFLALGKSKISFLLAILRKIVLLVPLIFILPLLIENKLFAVFLAEPIADITAAVVTFTCFMIFYKKTLSNIDE